MARIKTQYNNGDLKSLFPNDPVVVMDMKLYYRLVPAIKTLHKRAVARYERLKDIHESGEATEKQQTDLMLAEHEMNQYSEMLSILK